jgi:hypothetical protein
MKFKAQEKAIPELLEHKIDDLLADGVVTPRVVVGRVLLTRDQLFRVEQTPANTHLS